MTEDEFRSRLTAAGYGEPKTRDYESNTDGEFHTHDFSAMLMITGGEFRVVFEDRTEILTPGDWCEVPAGTTHYEQSGADGATVLAGRK